ncbi:hypothetical protein LINPERPRIM_LOCUS33212 [Linum perenne]
MEWNSVGWRPLLAALRSVLGVDLQVFRGEEKGLKSYAEVVAPRPFRREGKCLVVDDEDSLIKVEDIGVHERLQFLRRGVVFRLDALDGSLPDWKRFREWVSKWWGVQGWADIRSLGDDLWFLVCSSEEEVRRILSLGRWEFPGHRVRADKWMPRSGTSDVVERRGWEWVKITRIPLHLRSDALLRDIARCVGVSAVVDEARGSLNECWVRVQNADRIPEGVRLQYKQESFWVPFLRLTREMGEFVSKKVRMKGVVKKQEEIGSRGGDPGVRIDGSFRRRGRPTVSEVASKLTPEGAVLRFGDECLEKLVGANIEDERSVEEALLQMDKEVVSGERTLECVLVGEEEEGKACGGVGFLEEERSEGGVDVGLREWVDIFSTFWCGPVVEGGPLEGFGAKNLSVVGRGLDEGVAQKTSGPEGVDVAQQTVSELISTASASAFFFSESEANIETEVLAIEGAFSRQEGVSQVGEDTGEEREEEGLVSDPEDASLSELSCKIAKMLEIKLPGEMEVAEKEIRETAKKVTTRRKKSKLELELRRVNIEGSSSTSKGGRRGPGYVASTSSSNELA